MTRSAPTAAVVPKPAAAKPMPAPSADATGRGRRFGFVPRLVLGGAALVASVGAWAALQQRRETPVQAVEIVAVHDHDIDAFTQGLEFADGYLYEGTGKYGNSKLRSVVPETGRVVREVALPRQYFGEGITLWKDRVIQLTWKSRTGFVFNKESFELLERFRYDGEGWGLTHDANHLIMSDGSATLRYLDPESFEVVKSLRVTDQGRPVDQLNELEYINGEILANLWGYPYIARIDARTGKVKAWIDLSGVRPRRLKGDNAVLNGIAYDAEKRRLFVTGKNWSDLFEIRLKPR